MTKKLFMIILLNLIFVGCASKESLKTSSTTETICSHYSEKETYTYLVKELKTYYFGSNQISEYTGNIDVGGGKKIGMTGNSRIEHQKLSNNLYEITFSIQNGITHRMYGQMILISTGNDKCKTNVKINYMNRFWIRYGLIVKDLLNKQESKS
jgi:hypothetical protein